MSSKDTLSQEFKKEKQMPPKGISFTTWEADKKWFLKRYGDQVPTRLHPLMLQVLSHMKEQRMEELKEERQVVALDPIIPFDREALYFNNERHMDALVLNRAELMQSLETGELELFESLDAVDITMLILWHAREYGMAAPVSRQISHDLSL